MKQRFLITGCLLFLLSCNINRKLNKQSVATTQQSDITTTITERLDTSIVLKPDSVQGAISVSDLLNGKDLFADNGNATVEVHYDTLTRRIMAKAVRKAVAVPVQVQKTTTTQARIKTSSETNTTVKDKQATAGFKTTNLWILLAICILVFCCYLVAAFKKKRPGEQSQP